MSLLRFNFMNTKMMRHYVTDFKTILPKDAKKRQRNIMRKQESFVNIGPRRVTWSAQQLPILALGLVNNQPLVLSSVAKPAGIERRVRASFTLFLATCDTFWHTLHFIYIYTHLPSQITERPWASAFRSQQTNQQTNITIQTF